MPIFEYKCTKCGRVTEFLEIRSGKEKKACSHCGSMELTRLISSFAGIVKNHPGSSGCDNCPSGTCPYSSK